MKNIEPVKIWHNGKLSEASVLEARIINDDLKNHCTFYYELKEVIQIEENSTINYNRLTEGNVTLSGEDYSSWNGGNDFAYNYIADQLNLIIIE